VGIPRWRRRGTRLSVYVGLTLITITMLYPFWSMGSASFRSYNQWLTGHGFSLVSWHDLFQQLDVWRMLWNSTLITASAIGIILVVSTTAGYALGTLRFRSSTIVLLVIVAAMMVPLQSMIIPEYVNLAKLGFINHYYSAILVYAALGAPFATFLMTTYFRRLPEDVIEASLIDGLGYFKIYFRIMLPLAVPAIAAVVVLQFIQIWNDLLVGLLFLQSPQLRPITVGLATVGAQHTLNVPVLMAGSLASAIPEIIVFLVFQRYLIAGLTMGMSK
jgi:multiple sugar transport system permease protein/raffinose/stachyose/melibiose transport system permease protein